jgi:hypothetical protein
VDALNYRFFDIKEKPVRLVNIVRGAKSHIRQIDEHHHKFLLSYELAVSEIEYLEDYLI